MTQKQEDQKMNDIFADSSAGFQSDFISTNEYHENGHLGNVVKFAQKEVKRIDLKYFNADVSFLPNLNGQEEVVLKEYFPKVSSEYAAKSELADGTLSIQQGSEPSRQLLTGRVHVIVLIPFGFSGDFRVNLEKGSLLFDTIKGAGVMQVDALKSKIEFNNVSSKGLSIVGQNPKIKMQNSVFDKTLRLNLKSGKVALNGVVTDDYQIDVMSGVVRLVGVSGSGDFRVKTGSLRLNFKELNGDVNATVGTGTVWMNFPANDSFKFELTLSNGRIKAPVEASYVENSKNYVSGTMGEDPKFAVDATIGTGSIHMI